MSDQQAIETEITHPDPEKLSAAMAEIAERSQRLVSDFLAKQAEDPEISDPDPLNIGSAFAELTTQMMQNPAKLVEAQMELWQQYYTLWHNTTLRMLGEDSEPVVTPQKGDRRFRDEAWENNELFDFIKQSYLLSSQWMQNLVHEVDGLDEKTAQKVEFYTRQFVDAISPTNFLMTNPEVLRTTIETGGENLLKGLQNLLSDLERGKGKLQIRMTDLDAFKIGENVATTEGSVIGRTPLMELLQYKPSTDQVAKRPLMIVPPWINKYYILDLRPENSFIKWAVDQGHTVFVLSWVNPDSKLAEKSFEDYAKEGILAALDMIEQATGENEINAIGYCLGGTLLSSTLAYMAKVGDERIKSATFFTTLTDFEKPGELSVFVDDEQIESLERNMSKEGYLDGRDMSMSFNMLRANDLIWSFVVSNYMLGKDPFPFDLLYWNSDSTRMPKAMHSFYLRNMYNKNLLREPGGISILGEPIDLRDIKIPVYFLSTREDHIAPWQATYAGTQLMSGQVKFVLSASGHIAGVVNPPAAKKYCYWTYNRTPANPDDWMAKATQHEGSWWTDWQNWISRRSGGKVPARKEGDGKLKVLGPAPGEYVKVTLS
ncbi:MULTISPECIES: PHA/PHB synthase family protein [Thalassospira]|uniref:Class I poly(R)-hydroxyalkanoic acid synthase n=1 Tax=Thalassospira povalilytica TaxID=732237 RepID=A0A8I1M8B9_9PROT|nr:MULTISPECIES: class I poly(R)-hydroxyalkanoic acid synthase [Thalassospira]KZB60254.1 poly(3-hydroxyalkanoate) synthetase [Thalassospira sp. MCCC 1A02491]MBN8196968.1 class I poly(R)-hydroxyalkanoic acid synthase [Thalassospira povalilytica]MCC4241631.1 class I poly(R)-hydroxyalkanoic acid synthase [Thalassospira povalilytica]MEE3044911.1 class I poly(R)-hydroxyalkanoic acid synthase [Pseudomonadota bacterium]|eukprot:TRINITY_DN850_c0_g11_i1.p1 TRINITY_DN850_c0_g11~~TRINITY_DN850_c0_g11_i1.p1  ORF type:complete len:601 (-),score=124.93 TRINITY_DN850_c0_g11_i1:1947-3749(-)